MNALAEGDFVKTMDRRARTLGLVGGSLGSRQRGSLRLLLGAIALLGALILTGWAVKTDSARAKAEVFSYTSEPTTTQAGAHPDIVTTFVIGNRTNQAPTECYCNDPKDVILHAPPGVTANPHVLTTCTVADLALFNCPSDTQAGVVVLSVFDNWAIFPLFRMPTQKGQAGLLGFTLPFGFAIPIYISFNARTGSDYGLDVKTLGISHALPLLFYAPIFWGVPGDPVNDVLRFPPNEGGFQEIPCGGNPVAVLASKDNAAIGGLCNLPTGVPSSLPIAPFTQNPTTCAGPLISSIDTLAYDLETDHAEAPWPETTGCDALSFDPSLAANPTTSQADTASGLEVDLRVPLHQDPNTPTPSELRAAEITLPEGFSINPNAADGKTVCTDGEARIGTELPAECPEHSKVGTAVIDSSALPAPIDGYVYLGEQKPGDPYRVIVTANGFGTAIKLLGSVRPDSDTGRIVTVFEDLPQAPVQRTVLHFFGSERGLLATPEKCGTYAVESRFTPWAA